MAEGGSGMSKVSPWEERRGPAIKGLLEDIDIFEGSMLGLDSMGGSGETGTGN